MGIKRLTGEIEASKHRELKVRLTGMGLTIGDWLRRVADLELAGCIVGGQPREDTMERVILREGSKWNGE